MKRWLLLLLLTIPTLSTFAQAEYNVSWIQEEDKFVTTIPKATIYEMPDRLTFSSWRIVYSHRGVIDYDNFKTKTLKKPQTLMVRGYANKTRQLTYDTYVVEYKGRLYLLPSENVVDSILIENINTSLATEYSTLTTKLQSTKCELDSLVAQYTRECESQLAHYHHLKENLPALIDSVKAKAKADYQALIKAEVDKWYNALPNSTKNAHKRISIIDAELSEPNSAAGCDYTFTYVNNSHKTIKYLFWEGSFYNAVNDLVFCDIRDYCTFRGKDTGPVEPGEEGGGVWDCVIYNWSAEYVKLSSVSIIYMDGTSTTIGAGDIKRLTTMPTSWDLYEKYGTEYDAVWRASHEYERQLKDCDWQILTWEQKFKYMQKGEFMYSLSYHDSPFLFQGIEYKDVFARISELHREKVSLAEELSKFEQTNLVR